jgi:hypothetical protein
MTDTVTIDRQAPVGFKEFSVNWDDGSCGSIRPRKLVDGRTWLIGSFHSRRVGHAGSRSVVPIDEIVDAADEAVAWAACAEATKRAAETSEWAIAREDF